MQFVPPRERDRRRRQLEEAGVLAVVASWREVGRSVLPGVGSGVAG